MASDKKTVLVISQVYVPDPTSVGQHMHDAAAELARRGYRVIVYTSARGYDDPSKRYPARETLDGVEIIRLPLSSFGKGSIPLRLLGGTLMIIQTVLRALFTKNLKGILVSTSPPMASTGAVLLSKLRRAPIAYWVMDLNPDQMIVLGKTTETSVPARVFNFLNRMILRRAKRVVALDRFMADRLNRKVDVTEKMDIMPPWPHADHLESIEHADNPFRKEHNPDNKFVIMYSGNHGFSTPVTTVLQAALKLQHRDDLMFMFIGGGVGKKEVDDTIEKEKPNNVISLPYQPLSEIKYSLSAADVHLVSVGDTVVGVVHPCKVYGAMALARPILLLGPNPCHVSDMVDEDGVGWRIEHGDVDTAIQVINQIVDAEPAVIKEKGEKANSLARNRFSKETLMGEFCDSVEKAPGVSTGCLFAGCQTTVKGSCVRVILK